MPQDQPDSLNNAEIEVLDETFGDDIPLPADNAEAYSAIYRVENWLRRIALTAYMNKYGVDWANHLDLQMRNALQRRVAANSGRIYLDAESDDNLIWLTMHKELHRLLFNDEVWPFVHKVLSLPKEILSAKLTELNEIRNMLAHNRALTKSTSIILAGLCTSLEVGIHRFKMETLYGYGDILDEDEDEPTVNALRERGAMPQFAPNYQPFMSRSANVYELVSLPVEREDQDWVSISSLLRTYKSVLPAVLAFCLNAEGSEYRVLLPRALNVDDLVKVSKVFAANPPIWTDTPYSEQSAKFLYNPKVWIYQNRTPDE